MQHTLRIATFNTHKGVTHFSTRLAVHAQRDLLRQLNADIVFLQEVRDAHQPHRERFLTWPAQGQSAFLAEHHWPAFVYAKNAVYPAGHHGNALLSKFAITHSQHHDISAHRVEQRGMLHAQIAIPHWQQPLHAICLHLGLFAHWRRSQLAAVQHYVQSHIPLDAPLIIAGDFNDWSTRSGKAFANALQLDEVFAHLVGKPARSFPSWLPMLRLDRIYTRGFHIEQVEVISGKHFIQVSDHAILTATLTRTAQAHHTS